ncbi:MAG: NAD(P)-dependent oxidoreductase [Burkholderiales bacterium]
MRVGIAGTGRMGAAIAARLKAVGHDVAVWNRTAARARSLGFEVLSTPAELAKRSEAVITMLADGAAVRQVYAELLAGEVRGKLFIDMSTVRPAVSQETFSRVKAKGAAFIECPVGGSIGPAKEGKLFGFAGGEAADVERARPLLSQLCRRLEHVGPAGAGASMKLAVNLPLLVYYQGLGEALSLLKKNHLGPERILDIFVDTSGAPAMLKNRGPQIAAVLGGKAPPAVSVDVDTIRKDLREMLEEARSLGVALPVTAAALECYDEASRAGLGAKDCTVLPAAWLGGKGS